MVLKDGILNINTGFPIIIALNKSDILNFGEAQDYYKSRFEILITQIREFALALGASIFSISATRNKNLTELAKYVIHRSSGLKFVENPETRE